MLIQAWQIWIIIGIICIVIEIFDPAFFFLSLGIGAIVTGLLSFAISSTPLQIALFVLISFLAFLSMRKLGKKVLTNANGETNVTALKGKTGKVTETIVHNGKGYVKIGGEEWSALSFDNTEIAAGTLIIVRNVEGNKLIVEEYHTDTQ